MISFLKVKEINKIDEETEKCIYLLLDELVRGEYKYKKIIGVEMKIFEEVIFKRVEELTTEIVNAISKDLGVKNKLDSDCLKKFLQLITVLINNCWENARLCKEDKMGDKSKTMIDLFNELQNELKKSQQGNEIQKMVKRMIKLAD